MVQKRVQIAVQVLKGKINGELRGFKGGKNDILKSLFKMEKN